MTETIDLLVIGGGINGAGIARDAAGRGLSVLLCEQDDLAAHTSSASTKLIHGGLRYLEHGHFRLVREALAEREVLLAAAPHIIRPLRFVLPHDHGQRPVWMLRLGLWLYDSLAGRKRLAPTQRLDLRAPPHASILQDRLNTGFEYSDCWVDDARLVVLCALDAKHHGATVLTRTRFVSAKRRADHWRATLQHSDGKRTVVAARALVNAAGPWVGAVLETIAGASTRPAPRLVKGSHFVTRHLFDGDHAYIFQTSDKRVIFAIPFERDFTLIGTTDLAYESDPAEPAITQAETAYLCDAVNAYFEAAVQPDQIVWSFAGVRPLYDDDSADPSSVTRDYVLELDAPADAAPIVSVLGGKITTFRKLAEQTINDLAPRLGCERPSWTAKAPLPGGAIPNADFDHFLQELRDRYAWLAPEHLNRLARAYGTRIDNLLASAKNPAALGQDFGAGLTEAEIDLLVSEEWAETADDILWRRTKLGLHMTVEQRRAVDGWLKARSHAPA